jgi:hypothetical protein
MEEDERLGGLSGAESHCLQNLFEKGSPSMSEEQVAKERPCLHCMMVELIDDFFAEYPATAASDKVDTADADEVH